MEIIREEISADRNTANESMQIMLEGEITLPDTKADISKIVSGGAHGFAECIHKATDKLEFGGSADIDIIYLDKHNSIESISENIPLNDTMTIEGLTADSAVQLAFCADSFECHSSGERKISYKILGEVRCRVFDTYTGDVIKDIDGLADENIYKKTVCHTELVSKQPCRITVKEQLKIVRDKPNIESVAKLDVHCTNISAACCRDALSLTGDIKVTLLYVGMEGGDTLEVFSDEIPLNGKAEVTGADEGMLCCPVVQTEQVYYNILEDDDGESRILEVACVLCVYPNIFADKETTLLDDAYCPDRMLELKTTDIQAFKTVCCNKGQCPVKQPLETDGADMLQIYCAFGKTVLDSVTVSDGKTTAEGVLEVNVIYVTGSDEDPVCSFSGDIPFSHTLETPCSTDNMTALVDVSPQHIGFNMLSQREVEIRGMLSVNCIILDDISFTAVTDITEKPLPDGFTDSIPSVTVYTVKKGDTLWKLAKHFNTTVKEIAETNDIENPDLIYPDQRLIILKSMR